MSEAKKKKEEKYVQEDEKETCKKIHRNRTWETVMDTYTEHHIKM